jgi:hypothetical protein
MDPGRQLHPKVKGHAEVDAHERAFVRDGVEQAAERTWREGDELLELHVALKARLPDEPRHLAGWRPPPREF